MAQTLAELIQKALGAQQWAILNQQAEIEQLRDQIETLKVPPIKKAS